MFHKFCKERTKLALHVVSQELAVTRDQILGLTTELLVLKEDYRLERQRYEASERESRDRERELMDRIILMAQPGAYMALERERAARNPPTLPPLPQTTDSTEDPAPTPRSNVKPLVTPRVRTYPRPAANRGPLAAINDKNQTDTPASQLDDMTVTREEPATESVEAALDEGLETTSRS